MFKIIEFLLSLISSAKESTKEEAPHTIPASEAKKLWDKKSKGTLMKTSQAGLDLIEQFEGLKLSPYLDSVNIPTIGIGTTRYEDGTHVSMNDPEITEDRAYELLSHHLAGVEAHINAIVQVDLTQNQFDAISCFIYNVGQGSFDSSTLLKKLNAGDLSGAADEFPRWDKAGGVEIAGLLRRRNAERDLFLS